MAKRLSLVLAMAFACGLHASWYWPFGSSPEAEEKEPPRLSALMKDASQLIDEASDLSAEGKTDEAVEKYRKALLELDRIESENPERAQKPEFSTLRNKRAYVNAAIDSLLLGQVKRNAKAVAVSDTRALEERLAMERWSKRIEKAKDAVNDGDARTAHREVKEALAACTNAVCIVSAHGVDSAACCLTGDFTGACRSLDRARQAFPDLAKVSASDAQAMTNSLVNVRRFVVGWYEEVVATGMVVVACCEQPKRDATVSNSVARAMRRLQQLLPRMRMDEAAQLKKATERLRPTALSPDQDRPVAEFKTALQDFIGLEGEISAYRARMDRLVPAERPRPAAAVAARSPETERKPAARVSPAKPAAPSRQTVLSKREQVIADIAKGDFAAADLLIAEMLAAKPNGAMALNLKATSEARQGKLKEAEQTLYQAIVSNPHNHAAYYNMAILALQSNPDDKAAAKRYYETGRTYGGPEDPKLEALFK